MRFIKSLIAISVIPVMFAASLGCGNAPLEDDFYTDDTGAINFNVSADYFFDGPSEEYEINVTYKDVLFKHSAEKFNKHLALFAFGNAVSTDRGDRVSKFYRNADFTDIYVSPSYNEVPTENSCAYAFACKNVGDAKLISVAMRSGNYGAEWAGNFAVGSSGNHENFDEKAHSIYLSLNSYLKTYENENLKLLVTGYSRGGGMANALAGIILSNKDFPIAQENVYVYTFGSPRVIEKSNVKAYKNVFNIINSADMITELIPKSFGFYRHGKDIDIYSETVEELLKSLSEDIYMPPFTARAKTFSKDLEFTEYFIKSLTAYDENPQYALNTRENYFKNYEATISYILKTFFTLKSSTLRKIQNDFADKNTMFLLEFLKEDKLYEYLLPFIAEDGIIFSEEELRYHCGVIVNFIKYPAAFLLSDFMLYKNNFSRMLSMHYPETAYVLMKNYINK